MYNLHNKKKKGGWGEKTRKGRKVYSVEIPFPVSKVPVTAVFSSGHHASKVSNLPFDLS